MPTMTSHISIQSKLLGCRKHEVNATSTKSLLISQHFSASPNTVKLFDLYLETNENELTAKHMVYLKLQIEQINALCTFYIEPC
jgi:hypothetical protein